MLTFCVDHHRVLRNVYKGTYIVLGYHHVPISYSQLCQEVLT
jgi:hypothetical protein